MKPDTRWTAVWVFSAGAVVAGSLGGSLGCGGALPAGPDPDPAPAAPGPGIFDGSNPAFNGGRAPAPRPADPPPPAKPVEPQPNALGRIVNAITGGGKPAGDPPAAAKGEHTLTLETFTGPDHRARAGRMVEFLRTRGLPDGFVVDQGEDSIVCYGRYPAPKVVNGRTGFPAEMVGDKEKVVKLFTDRDTGACALRPEYRPTPFTITGNPFSLADAKGEWTLHFMSLYGEPDSKWQAIQLARDIRREYKVPAFVIRNDEQFLVCVGDVPAAGMKVEPYPVVRSPLPKFKGRVVWRTEKPEAEQIVRPVSDEARKVWDVFRVFHVNGRPHYIAPELRGNQDATPVASPWLRISELRGLGKGGLNDLTEEERAILGGGR
jgi:hypothetical protein